MNDTATASRHIGVGTFRSTPLMHELVRQVLDSNQISYGDKSRAFERAFADVHAARYAVLSNSGTSALQVALQAMMDVYRWSPGCHVIVPATTFIATANIVRHCHMVPVFVDVDPATYNIDPAKVEDVLTRDMDVRAILPVHLFGQTANMSAIMELASRFGKQVLVDSCETMFATHCGKPLGYWGDIVCFSTYVAHLLVTGVGGLSLTNDPALAAKMRSLVNHGLAIEYLNPDENFAPRPMIGRRFIFDTCGYSYRISEMEAALGLAQLETYPEMLRIRARNAHHLSAGLSIINRYRNDPLQLPTIASGNEVAWMMYPLVLNQRDGVLVDKLPLMAFLNQAGIETRDMLPILGQPVYGYLNASDFPVSKWILESGFYLGCHQDLTPADIQYVVGVVADYFDNSELT